MPTTPRSKQDALNRLKTVKNKLSNTTENILENGKIDSPTINKLVEIHGHTLRNLREVRFYVQNSKEQT